MPNIKKIDLAPKSIIGLKTRAKNTNVEPIGALWGRFISTFSPPFPHYGVYYNYESDVHGEYDVLAGVDVDLEGEGLDSVIIEAGKYLKFSAKGELHQAVQQCWEQVWAYFEDPSIDERRAYETDFEVYRSMDEVEVYIGVHYF